MDLQKYKEYLIPTVEIYNKKTIDNIISILLDKEIIIDKEIKERENKVVIQKEIQEYDNLLVGAIDIIGLEVIKEIEMWEYVREYQYSILYKTALIDKEKLIDVLKKNQIKFFDECINNVEKINPVISHPTAFIGENEVILKFSLGKMCINPETEKPLKQKYTINVVFHLNSSIVEIRYNAINGLFVDDYKGFYKRNLSSVKAWLATYLNINVEKFAIDSIVDELKKDKTLRLEGQDMRFSDGGKACLEVGSNELYTLPLLGELKNIILENQEEFNKSIAIKQILETWINSKEEEADYLWVCLCWPDDKGRKTYDVKVRFQFDYFDEDESLLYHYSGPIGMERMNKVVRSIIDVTE